MTVTVTVTVTTHLSSQQTGVLSSPPFTTVRSTQRGAWTPTIRTMVVVVSVYPERLEVRGPTLCTLNHRFLHPSGLTKGRRVCRTIRDRGTHPTRVEVQGLSCNGENVTRPDRTGDRGPCTCSPGEESEGFPLTSIRRRDRP